MFLLRSAMSYSYAQFLASPPLGSRILRQQASSLDAELDGHEGDGLGRHVRRLLQEGAQKPDGAELDGEAQPHVLAAAPGDEGAVPRKSFGFRCVVEVEVAGQLLGAGSPA